jgi:hypothetical protein
MNFGVSRASSYHSVFQEAMDLAKLFIVSANLERSPADIGVTAGSTRTFASRFAQARHA